MTKVGKRQGTVEPNRYFSSKIDPKTGKRKVRKLTKGQQAAKATIERQNRYHSNPAPKPAQVLTAAENNALTQGLTGQLPLNQRISLSRQSIPVQFTEAEYNTLFNSPKFQAGLQNLRQPNSSIYDFRFNPENIKGRNFVAEVQSKVEPQPTSKPQKLSVAERLKNASPEVQQRYASRFGKGGFLSKLKGKAGKTLLVAGVAYGLYKLGSALFGGSDEKTDDVKEEQKTDKNQEIPAAKTDASAKDEAVKDNKTEKTDSSTVVPVVPPAVDNNNDEKVDETKEEQKTEKPDEVKKEQNAEEKDDVKNDKKAEEAKESGGFEVDEDGAYTVKKGDCVWNIAKAYLVTSGKDSSDKAIQAQVDKIMDANPNLKWKSKGDIEKYFVDIFVGDKIIIPNTKKAEKADEVEKAKKAEAAKDTIEAKKAKDAEKAEEVKDTLETKKAA